MTRVAIAGMACRYPDARTPRELWENVLAKRQAFRRIPAERLPLADYYSPDPDAPDRTYSAHAAVLHDWTFDRAAFRVSEATYEATDPAHWLALQVAAEAIGDCGRELPVERTAVIVGNTLTGDASRAASLRLRWPYVRRAAEAAGSDAEFLRAFEREFKAPFAAIGEESLAGGLSNTIAGRICNYFGFHGGGYAIDGACSSSLLAVAQACNALAAGDVDAVVAGGVDLSLDPFELIGFAKCTALARERMFVYDRRANGFLPGEGCGFVVLLREGDARDLRVYATIAGWGISSDGHGGMTRPESRGQRLALSRAYERARCTARDVAYFEGHGTGTPVGDPIEIQTIRSLLGDTTRDHYLGSVKANIGHTKAAAGIAGLLKATLAVHHGTIPPVTACEQPREELSGALRVSAIALPWEDATRRAGVSAMGFGGINTHVVVESDAPPAPSPEIAPCEAPLFLFDGHSEEEVRRAVDAVVARELSLAEESDLAHALQRRLCGGPWRATISSTRRVQSPPRVAFLFSGQASLPFAEQRTIVEASLRKLRELRNLGIEAEVAIGHSLGELTALHWAGVIDEDDLLALVTARGEAMKAVAGDGAMAAFVCDASEAASFSLSIAAINAPRQTVLSGPRPDVERAMHAAHARGIAATLLPVAAAFHSPMMAGATDALRAALQRVDFKPPRRRVISTIGGNGDIAERLIRQLTSPVLFHDALQQLDAELIIEVGPGRVLAQLANGLASEDLLACAAAFWECGGAVRTEALFEGRFTRRFDLEHRPTFITSPCERTRRAVIEPPPVAVENRDAESVLRSLVAAQTALPLDLVASSSRLLSDLHLSSITVGRILGEAARLLGAPPLLDPTSLANATIAEAASTLDRARSEPQPEPPADGIAPWVRAFEVIERETPLHTRRITEEHAWRFLGRHWPELRARFETVRGRGIVLVAPDEPIPALLELAKQLEDGARAVIVQHDTRLSGFARTLFLERPRISVRVVDSHSVDEIAADAEASGDFCEAIWRDGIRYEPRVRVLEPRATRTLLGENDTILVTGTTGIGVELARHLVNKTGAKLLLIGRSTGHDVTEPLPPMPHVTAIIHAAGINEPSLIDALDEDAFRNTIDVKCAGLRNVLAAVDTSKLRLLVTFGSVIARTGLRGEAHYATANEWLARDTEEFARTHRECRTLCLEWSVWAGGGMGVRLGALESLRRQGVVPLGEEEALRIATELIDGDSPTRVTIAGRLGDPPTIRFDDDEPPLLRFVDNLRVHVPGIELVADTALSVHTDPYLADHTMKGEPLLPAVMGLEAMAQAVVAVTREQPSRIEQIDLRRPIGSTRLRVAALATGDRVEAVLRTSHTQVLFDHFRAVFRMSNATPEQLELPDDLVDLDPAAVYEHLLFHTGRFRRIRAYRVLRAFECAAELTPSSDPWFHRYAPPATILGDAAMRDAAIHALQACIPQSVVLPVAVESIDFHQPLAGDAIVLARETARDGDDLLWDLDLATPRGRLIERWRGLRLRPVEHRANIDPLPPALWGPLLERECGVRVAIGSTSSDDAMRAAAQSTVIPIRRADGKPLLPGSHVSASHDGALTMAVADAHPVGCDLQIVDGHPWPTILHPRDLALAALCADTSGDEERFAAARVWAARESCAKAAGDALLPLTLDTAGAPRRVTFSAGDTRIDTFAIGDRIAAIAHRIERSHR